MRLRSLVFADLPRPLVAILFAWLASAFGNGLILPFTAIYLHSARGIAIPLIGLIFSAQAVAGLTATVSTGRLIERFGARVTTVAGCALGACSGVAFVLAVNPVIAAIAAMLAGASNGMFWPGVTTLIGALTTPQQRSHAASIQFAVNNLGIGIGAALAGFVVSIQDPHSYALLFLTDTATFAVFGSVVFLAARGQGEPERRAADEKDHSTASGYRAVLGDRALLALGAFSAMMVLAGYSQLEATIPLYARVYEDIRPAILGLMFTSNTAVIVFAQLPITRLLRNVRRSRALMALAVIWGVAWAFGVAGSFFRGAIAAALLFGFAMIFAAGECIQSGTIFPLGMDLSSERTRGHYMAALSFTWSGAYLIGPPLGAFVVASPQHQVFWVLLLGGAGVMFLIARLVERLTPRSALLPNEAA